MFFSLGGTPTRAHIAPAMMPPETYDSVWPGPGKPTAEGQFLTSDQCLGCHSAGGTGLQYDMTQPGPDDKLINISPYGTWRGSPMGLAGRDPIFFAQLASETDKFHPESSKTIQNTCLGCHGILGQRQHAIDNACEPFAREMVDKTPFPPGDDPVSKLANYGALAREGISCTSCHRMVLGKEATEKYQDAPQNKCIPAQQQTANPGLTGFAATFTGNFFVGPPGELYGPFKDPKKTTMKHAIGIDPAHSQTILSPELCGSCHTVHVPILSGTQTIGHAYEQTTYPEWAFSDYRTGDSVDGVLPYGSGPQAQSCQGCHMPNKDVFGNPYRSKIAAIQEYNNFPQAEHTLPASEIDLPVRSGFGKHTLVGLNVFLLKMAWQFPDILGIRKSDPMLTDTGIDSIPTAEGAMLDQAVNRTATVTVADVRKNPDALSARVTVVSRVGHKFPSGVGFRRAFIEFSVLDVNNKVLWSSGRTNGAGVLIDQKGDPIAGEMWWNQDCSARIDPDARIHQPHYQEITRQDQAQIYQELVAEPPKGATAETCGPHAKPQGPLTTSFLSICAKVKDNRILPSGFLKLEDRIAISKALGANDAMAIESGADGVGDDPDYQRGGSDSLVYRVPYNELGDPAKVAAVQATLYYQATPPFFLQDRFCTSNSADTKRLFYLTGKLNLAGTLAQDWKLRVVTSGPVSVP
jgi:cytochrome c551/c552